MRTGRAGICLRDLPGAPGPAASAAVAARLGFGGVHLPSVHAASPTLDHGELAELAAAGAEHGVSFTVGGGFLAAHHLDRAAALTQDGDLARGLARVLAAAAVLGTRELAVVLGPESDRFDPVLPWSEQLRATAVLFRLLAGVLRDAGARLVVKTHEEVTTEEVVRLVEEVGPDVVAIGFDPVNVLVRLEDPVAAARRVAGAVATVHVDDARIARTPRGFVRRAALLGTGVVDWAGIDAALADEPRRVDLHRAEPAMPAFDARWLAAQPATALDLARTAGWAGPDREPPSLADRLAAA
ncbi:TIM barrel protein [Pseudonocardia sp. WMMC193]|uniref:TIM barrel protein n=1 Tax=Pseudonocardia sp. WMMC193 TaxID=2911965 RepID=UPI001F260F19|nr:TIM barrel protein [Pseudonocardia sp. WMMC193]MCF7547536.1 TIM barrel protein [Pseudonocardia sp. WMMC193]